MLHAKIHFLFVADNLIIAIHLLLYNYILVWVWVHYYVHYNVGIMTCPNYVATIYILHLRFQEVMVKKILNSQLLSIIS